MVNIDLKTNSERPASEASTDFSLMFMIFLTVVTLGIWGGMYFWEGSLTKNVQATDDQIKMETTKLSRQQTKDVMDLQNRIRVANEFGDGKNMLLDNLAEIEKLLVADAYVNSINYSSGVTTITLMAKDFVTLAKQISSFKQSGGIFTNVSTGPAHAGSDGKVETTISLKVN